MRQELDATCKMLVPVVESLERKFYYDRFEKEIQSKAISNFAEWCYLKGVDFSYMSTSDKSGRQFIDDVIARYCKEQMKEVGE